MTVQPGDALPSLTLAEATPDGPKELATDDLFRGRTVVLFGVPGAFTPTCSARHLPGFVDNAAAFAAKGVDTLACLAVNDAFVLQAWAGAQDPEGAVRMLADGSGTLTRALGLELDLSARNMGIRCQRFVMIARAATGASSTWPSKPRAPLTSAARRACSPCSEGGQARLRLRLKLRQRLAFGIHD